MHIVFTIRRGLVGLVAKRMNKSDFGAYWKAVNNTTAFTTTLSMTFEGNTLPAGPYERMITCQGPFARCDRETDDRHAWAAFAEHYRPTATRNKL